MKFVNVLIFMTFISCASNEKLAQNEKKAKIFYNQGTNELQFKDYTKALQYLLQANKYKPNDTKILNNLGMAYYFKEAPDKAIALIKRAIEISPENADARVNLGTIYMKQGDFAKARQQYNIVMKDLTYSSQFRTYYNLGIIDLHTKNDDAALKNFQKAVDIRAEYCSAHFQIGHIYYKNRKFDKALASYNDSAFGTCYNNPEPAYHQALSLIKLERFNNAREKLQDITERFAMTPYAKKAKEKLGEISILERQSVLENERRLFINGNILTPSF